MANSEYTKVTYHRDGTVTYWSVFLQGWVRRVDMVRDDDLASMEADTREKVIKHIGKNRVIVH